MRKLRRWAAWTGFLLLFAPTALIILYRNLDPPITPLMLLRLAQGEALEYQPVPLARVSPNLIAAVIAAEDNLFCRHYGFDAMAMQEEIGNWLGGDRPRGASTITMQTAKNVLLWPGRDLLRKLMEAWLTPQLELLWSKRRILEVYLGVAEMGPGVYGAEAASQRYFRQAIDRARPSRSGSPGGSAAESPGTLRRTAKPVRRAASSSHHAPGPAHGAFPRVPGRAWLSTYLAPRGPGEIRTRAALRLLPDRTSFPL